MEFKYSDGGRSKYFKTENVNDCVVRAICNATGKDYKEVYKEINELAKTERTGKRKRGKSSSRNGVYKSTERRYLEGIGWEFHPTTRIGEGCTMHLRESEIPNGTIIVQLTHHLTCVKDKVIYDTFNCSERKISDGWGLTIWDKDNRCVYGYWTPCSEETLKQREEERKIKEEKKYLEEQRKLKVESIRKAYRPKLSKIEKRIKELQHQLKLETNRMNREIERVEV